MLPSIFVSAVHPLNHASFSETMLTKSTLYKLVQFSNIFVPVAWSNFYDAATLLMLLFLKVPLSISNVVL